MPSRTIHQHEMRKTRVAIVGTTGLPARYGGFETLAHHLVDQLNKDVDFTVYCSSNYFANKKIRRTEYNGARLKYFSLNANGYQSILYDFLSMIHAVRNSDVLLVLGISGALLIPFIKMFSKKPVIVNIDGQEWRRPKWNWLTRRYLKLSERIAVKFATVVIGDNEKIVEYVEQEYGRMDIRLIEYGSDHVKAVAMNQETIHLYPFLKNPYAFTVCRIEPENNIHVLLQAFATNPSEQLVVVGLWNHGTYGMQLRDKYRNCSNLFLLDPVYDQQQLDMLRSNATLYVHGHSAGGTNPSLVEAMQLELPVMAYDVSYNRATTENKAMYFANENELGELLKNTNQKERKACGQTLKLIAQQRYTWKKIARAYNFCINVNDHAATDKLLKQLYTRKEEQIRMKPVEKSAVTLS